ncbi:ankyrin repeat domain-containing protein 45 [Aplochiton taeniatus]
MPAAMLPYEQSTIFHYACSGNVKGLQQHFENESINDDQSSPLNSFKQKDEMGRNALSAASMLGRSAVVRELVKQGAPINQLTSRGYSALHLAALWGHLETVKALMELGADLQLKNFQGERAIEVAARYLKIDCAEYLTWSEAKQDLQSYIAHVRDIIADPDKIQGKLNKEDKNICSNACLTKSDWIQNTSNLTVKDFLDQKKQLEATINPILHKLNSQPEPTTKAGKT